MSGIAIISEACIDVKDRACVEPMGPALGDDLSNRNSVKEEL